MTRIKELDQLLDKQQEKFVKLTQDQFFAESETVYTRSQTRLTIITHPTSRDHDVIAHPHRPLRG